MNWEVCLAGHPHFCAQTGATFFYLLKPPQHVIGGLKLDRVEQQLAAVHDIVRQCTDRIQVFSKAAETCLNFAGERLESVIVFAVFSGITNDARLDLVNNPAVGLVLVKQKFSASDDQFNG
jgi:hypothetical protein